MKVLVLGGGPAGVSAALHAQELGADVTLVEAKKVGGTSLNDGPAPVRTMARAARLVRDTGSWEMFGLRGERPRLDMAEVLANAERVASYAHEHKRMADFLRLQGIELVDEAGPARFTDPHTVRTDDGRTFRGDVVIMAVGGRAGRLDIPGAELALTYTDVRSLDALPSSVAIVGGADTGCQLASILADFGTAVTVIEASPRLVARADADISIGLNDAFRRRGISVLTNTFVERLTHTLSGVAVHLRSAGTSADRTSSDGTFNDGTSRVDVEAVFFAVGWPSNADLVGAEAIGIPIERGFPKVGDDLRTAIPHIFAAGDVTGLSMLVPSAWHEGRIASENAVLGTRRRVTHDIVPTGSFTDPEYGSVGLTEAEARAQYDCTVGVVTYDDLLRPVADGRAEGFCKLIVESRRRFVLGAHVLGEYSAEVVQMVAACMTANLRVEQIAEMQFAFPTFTEAVGMAAQAIVRELGIAPLPPSWSDLHPPD
jgi:pyruvate/2-oxoglutarate dehydrogenase complex dihydrolipoamide dehydrogenase (E3) component